MTRALTRLAPTAAPLCGARSSSRPPRGPHRVWPDDRGARAERRRRGSVRRAHAPLAGESHGARPGHRERPHRHDHPRPGLRTRSERSCTAAPTTPPARRAWRRVEFPVGPLFCIIDGPTRGRPWSGAAVRSEFRRVAARAGVQRRFAPHQLRHAHALELARQGVPLNIIQRQLGHANLGTTSI
jgi:hypothetical protein